MSEPPQPISHPGFQGLIGVAREDITPPAGIYARNWGAAAHDAAEGVHRPLTATAITFQAEPDGAPLALVALDLGWWRSGSDERSLRDALLQALDLSPDRLLISLSHTHAGPVICREEAGRPGGILIGPYLERVRDVVSRALRTALQRAVPAALEWTSGRCDLARNRDLPDPDRDRMVCGVNPALPADDALLVGRVSDAAGRPAAVLVNYACHPTTLAWENRLISPDYVGALREVVERDTGAPCLFLQGASGELAPREQYTGDPLTADRNGEQVGYAVLSALRGMLAPRVLLTYERTVESGAPLAIWRPAPGACSTALQSLLTEVELALKPGPPLSEIDRRLQAETDPIQAERLRRRRRILQTLGDGESTQMPVWTWQIGDALLIAQPNEAYSSLQMELRQRFPDSPVIVMNTTNGPYCGYLPPADLYSQDHYPIWQTPFAQGCLEQVTHAASGTLERIRALPSETFA